ncbi:glycine--tRNA ligase subunit beta [Sphingomonas immobilis]|uniref:Glycine--tRNA ligase beta subunit n=1 Tax=Sphingomonas immobilis TaxID=3063997 RepID=A0ABT8ZYA4_9SPHN|nr:glycine--tRNA ligase subunit beta [Sphingomonas sp. CA1-15]MDO7842546.1 glycine--tRNA ligase subunit beta [Sphingomonas sp. CA1-15]
MMDFLLELRSEEIPARMQDKARDDLARLFAAELAKAGLHTDAIVTFATPRRLALIARDLPAATAESSEETKGPKTSAPPQALEGFLRKTGLSQDQLVERDGVYFAVLDKPGRPTAEVLAEAIPAVIRAFPWPKSMRWGDASASTESLRWVRPLQGIVALLGEEIVPCEIAGVTSGAATLGHRFHHPGVITIGSASDYEEKLRACHVIVDQDERRQIIALGAKMAARKAGLELIEDTGLLTENAGLTEWPVPLLGRFDAAFLAVPPEVIQLTARVNQKYFVCRDAEGKLANAFVCTANIDAADGGTKIVEGNRKVLAARLSDAKFFYETDLKVPLEEQAKKLANIVFHEKLGTVADKVERVAKLARWLVEEGIVGAAVAPAKAGAAGSSGEPAAPNAAAPASAGATSLADLAERAARLAKADLVTGMVGEFPELQGLMGGYYAAAQGEPREVWEAVRDHYKPVGQGDEVPTAPVTVAVSLADKLDTIGSFFAVAKRPSGSKDPFALRRAALGVIQVILRNSLRFEVTEALLEQRRLRLEQLDAGACFEFDGLDAAGNAKQTEMTFGMQYKATAWVVSFLDYAKSWGAGFGYEYLMPDEIDAVLGYVVSPQEYITPVRDFFADRLKVQQREAGVRHDLIDAVFALGGEDDLVRLLARVHALQAFIATPDGANLLAGYKRAANILKKEGFPQSVTPAQAGVSGDGAGQEPHEAPASAGATHLALSYTPEPAEAALAVALASAEPAAADAVAREDFEGAMSALASLRAPIDAFFDSVIVNDPERDKRLSRLALLDRVRAAVHNVADFSRIDG